MTVAGKDQIQASGYRWRRALWHGLVAAVLLGLSFGGARARAADRGAAPTPGAAPTIVTDATMLSLNGHVVHFSLSGVEPDFDPIDRVIIAARLRDPRPAASALPDATLVLSTYLENFQPKTMPVLPDLLRQDRTATSLGGFMQGKAALVDGAGRVRYRGSILAEVFLDNTVHAIVDLDPQGRLATATLRLMGAFTLRQDLTLAGVLRPTRAIAPAEAAALRVTHPGPISWQAVVAGMRVRFPKMVGTGGGAPPVTPPQPGSAAPAGPRRAGTGEAPATRQALAAPTKVALALGPPARPRRQNGPAAARARTASALAQAAPIVVVVALFIALSVAASWRARRGKRRSGAATAT